MVASGRLTRTHTSNDNVSQNLHPQGYLVIKYNLNLIGRPKPVIYIDDFVEVLSCLWCSDRMHFPAKWAKDPALFLRASCWVSWLSAREPSRREPRSRLSACQ